MAELDWSLLRTPDFATNALRAQAVGREQGLDLAKQNALRTYASDPDAGIRQLMSVDPATAVTLQKAQAEQRQQASAVQAGQAAASGDLEGAGRIAAASGNFDLASKIQSMTKEQRDQASETYGQLASAAQSVASLPYEQRRAALQVQTPRLQALGLSPDQIAAFDPTDQNIASFTRGVLGVKDQIDLSRQERTDAKPAYTTFKDGPVERLVQTNPEAEGATFVPGQGWTGGAPAAPQSAPGAPPVAAVPQGAAPQPAGSDAPRGLRNNNPLNLRSPGAGQWDGQTAVDNAGYAVFASPQDGWNAAHQNLIAYATRHGINTIQGVIGRWAPAGDGGNNPQAYAATVAKALGVAPDAQINLQDPGVREKLLSAMANVELGQPYSGPQATAQGAPVSADIGSQPQGQPVGWQPHTVMTGRAEPKIQQLTAADGTVHLYDVSDPAHPTELPVQGVANQEWQVLTDPKTNTQYRYNPRTGTATTLDGASPYTPQGAQKIGGGSARSGIALALQEYLNQNPGATPDDISRFNAQFRAQQKATSDFGTGAQGKVVNSLNVAVDHLATLDDLATAMQNGDVQSLNRIKQGFQKEFGVAAPTNFAAAKQMVAGEIAKVITGGGASALHDREEAETVLNAANSPQQLAGAIKTIKALMAGQLNGLRLQYRNTTRLDDFESKLSPRTRAELENLGGGEGGASASANAPPASALKPNVNTTFRNGQTWTLRNGQPVRLR